MKAIKCFKLTCDVNLKGNPCLVDSVVTAENADEAVKNMELKGYGVPTQQSRKSLEEEGRYFEKNKHGETVVFVPCKVTQVVDVSFIYNN